jgi:hypothetical protein
MLDAPPAEVERIEQVFPSRQPGTLVHGLTRWNLFKQPYGD